MGQFYNQLWINTNENPIKYGFFSFCRFFAEHRPFILLDKGMPGRPAKGNMAQTLEQTQEEILNIQQARMAQLNEDNKRFLALESSLKELQIADKAQITLNQQFYKQISDLEIRLKKEENKPLVAIPPYNPIIPTKQSFFNRLFKK